MSTRDLGGDEALIAQLGSAAAMLNGVFADRARTFVETGDELVKAVGVFRELTSVFESLPDALSNEDLSAGSAALEDVAQDCVAIHDAIPGQLQSMDSLGSANGNIGKRLDQLKSSISFVASIALNARIEASALKSNGQDILAFTHEVAKLAQAAEETIHQYEIEQRSAHEALRSSRAVLADFGGKHRSQLGTIATELRRNLASIEGRRNQALSEATHISARSRQIASSIGTLITALQIADISSQRFAHVHESIDLLIAGLTANDSDTGEDWWSDLDQDEREAVAAEVSSLQIAQIDNALRDLRSETQSMRDEIAKLVRDAGAMGAQGASIYGTTDLAGDSFLGELASRIDVAGHLLSNCQKASSVAAELNEGVGARFGTLHQRAASLQGIVGIVGGVRLIGLNAHLKSDGLGPDGRTLSAISRELRNSADSITMLARDLIKEIDQTVLIFNELKSRNSAMGAGRFASLTASMSKALSAFQESGSQLAAALKRLSMEGSDVCSILSAAMDRLSTRDELERRLEQASEILRAVGKIAKASGQTGRVKARTSEFFTQRYTMAAERNVHAAQAAPGRSRAGAGSALAEVTEDDLDSILF
jgi:hypothetical protein